MVYEVCGADDAMSFPGDFISRMLGAPKEVDVERPHLGKINLRRMCCSRCGHAFADGDETVWFERKGGAETTRPAHARCVVLLLQPNGNITTMDGVDATEERMQRDGTLLLTTGEWFRWQAAGDDVEGITVEHLEGGRRIWLEVIKTQTKGLER